MNLLKFTLISLECIALVALNGCAYTGPRVSLTVGFMGASVGVVVTQPTDGFAK